MSKFVNIVYPVDSQVWINCYVSIISLLENTNRKVNIILLGKPLDLNIKKHFKNLEYKYQDKCKITIGIFDTSSLRKYNIPEFENANSWSRILLPEIYADIDKLIIMSGAATIFNFDIARNIQISFFI